MAQIKVHMSSSESQFEQMKKTPPAVQSSWAQRLHCWQCIHFSLGLLYVSPQIKQGQDASSSYSLAELAIGLVSCLRFFGAGAFPFDFPLPAEPSPFLLSTFFAVCAFVFCFFAPVASFIMTLCLNGEDVTMTADSAFRVLALLPCILGGGDNVLISSRTTNHKAKYIWTGQCYSIIG